REVPRQPLGAPGREQARVSPVTEAAALSPAAERLRTLLAATPHGSSVEVVDLDLPTLEVGPDAWLSLARWLRDDPECRFDLFLDMAGVDNLRRPRQKARSEAASHLLSLARNEHIRVKVLLPDVEAPALPSVTAIWPGADWYEREAFDLFGFRFTGHPNLKRLLCHDAFVGHALRKDYAPGQRWMFTEADMDWPEWARHTEERAGHFETQTLSIGPAHPATHGIVHLIARLDGEKIIRA